MIPSNLASVHQANSTMRASLMSSTAMIRATATVSRRCRPYQQMRGFRFGMWASYLDPTFQEEVRRRHKTMKRKSVEALNHKVSWDRLSPIHSRHHGFKSFMCSAWRGRDLMPGGRWVDFDELERNSSAAEKPKHGGIEDVEQSSIDWLFRSQKKRFIGAMMRGSNLFDDGLRQSRTDLGQDSTVSASESKLSNQASAYDQDSFRRRFQTPIDSNIELEYKIDPITNRRVIENKSGAPPKNVREAIDVPVKTFKGYGSSFRTVAQPANPVRVYLKGHEKEEQKPVHYNESVQKLAEEPDPVRESLKAYEQSNKEEYKPVYYREPDGKLPEEPDSVKEALKPYDAKKSYARGVWGREPDERLPKEPCTVQEGLKSYDEKHPYGPVRGYEPDGQPPTKPCSVKAGLKDYDDKHPYGPVRGYEPDGQLPSKPCPVQAGLKDYDDKHQYGPVRGYEPDGQPPAKPCSVRESLKDYDKKNPYGPVRGYEPDGKLPVEACPVQEGLKEYDSKVNYKDGLDGMIAPKAANPVTEAKISCKIQSGSGDPVQDGLNEYDRKVSYGLPKLTVRERISSFLGRDDRSASRPIFDQDTTEDLDLLRPSDVRAASGITRHSRKETELEKSAKRQELENVYRRPQDFEGAYTDIIASKKVKESRKLVEDARIEHSELLNHAAHAKGRIDAKIAEVEAGWPEHTLPKKMTGNYVRDFPEEFDAVWTKENSTSGNLVPRTSSIPKTDKLGTQESDVGFIEGTASKESFSRHFGAPRLETSLDRSSLPVSPKSEEIEKLKSEPDLYSKTPQGLETNYAEECASKQGEGDLSIFVSSYGTPNGKEASEGQTKASDSSQTAKNLQKQAHRDLVREVRGIYEDAYGTIDSTHRQVPNTQGKNEPVGVLEVDVSAKEPTLYKILAYDPTMQSISIAETTSIVSDSASPLTPAEVLLRLSNPAKFFPHFSPLQSQGYEIVSGSGDVLIFRKVRSGSPLKPRKEPLYAAQDRRRKANPIDGMVATGNFASPTGFVNHDLPEPSEPPFKSNIDVRREEPVFSGRSTWEGPRPKPRGRGKRLLIGAAWVAACSYAVGVVAEFFRTGGIDGVGTVGF